MIKTEIINGPITPFQSDDNHRDDGAEVVFNGRVRDTENGKQIIALEYEHYEKMTEKEIQALAEEAAKKFPIRDLSCRHRIGKVPVGEASLHVSIWAEHRQEAIQGLDWFIRELKKRVPVWKWAVYPDGTKEASSHESC
ncbi:MAG: molybdenum cofactor biosynthesis protein MoaE [Candidatus Marinimicrobia bacterium]|jgi:molybdopterin synthase catalytic subunit|nr:molybdenum cofactor biosynthesis protein MoaE [Candidatus Neomarinimicrobiota bacterium]MDP6790163.1 molybdenum cofactor biosynthesis protein MoaE [Candidatus Neomarinimicrobiota bacterium]MDP7072088.1 molybdenum cofactor biosynthesis protein MoaE [Candidatus Neomarinimicrobiota bacterium]